MAHILINNSPCPQFSNFKDLNLLLGQITINENLSDKFITEVNLNGALVDILEATEGTTLSEDDRVELKVLTSIQLAFEVIDSTSKYIEVIIKKVDEMVLYYLKGEQENANLCFADIIDLVDIFTQLITKTIETFSESGLIEREVFLEVTQIESKLLMIFKGILNAKELNNYSMLCDLLQYELIDNLTQWKIQIFSKIQKSAEQKA